MFKKIFKIICTPNHYLYFFNYFNIKINSFDYSIVTDNHFNHWNINYKNLTVRGIIVISENQVDLEGRALYHRFYEWDPLLDALPLLRFGL